MTPQEIQALAQGIVGTFISSIPNIVTQVNQQNKNNRANSAGGGRSNVDQLDNDFNRAMVHRIKKENDVTHSLVGLIQARNKELRHITTFNATMVDLIRKQGTYDNLTNRLSSNLRESIREANGEFSKLFEQMHDVGDRAKKINIMMNNAANDFNQQQAAGNLSGASTIAENISSILTEELKELKNELAIDQGMSADIKRMIDFHIKAIEKRLENLKTNSSTASSYDITPIVSMIKSLDKSFSERDSTFTKEIKKMVSELGVDSSELSQKLEHVEDFYKTYGDKFPEPAELNELTKSLGDLAYQQKMFNITGEKTADEVDKFTQGLVIQFNELFPRVNELVKEVKRNTNKLNWKDFVSNIKEGFKELSPDKIKSSYDDYTKTLPKPFQVFLKLAETVISKTGEAASKIADDQLNVQKYGVNMKKGPLDSFSTNYQDAVRAGITPAQMAEWKQQNRVTGGVLGGERTATDQFKHFMGAVTDKDATKVTYNGQEQTFSELIGGDSQYKKETYDSIVQSLVENGIDPTEKNIKTSLTKDDNGIMKVAYKLGLLPKELTDFHTSLTESAAFNVTAMNGNSEATLNSVDSFQLLGQKLGLSTTATQALTKQMYDDSHKKGADMLKTGIVARIVAKQLGFSDKEAAQIGKMNQMQGNMLNQYLAKNPEQGELMKQFRIKTEQSRQSELVGDSLQAHPMSINAIMESDPALMSNLNMLSGLANQNKATGQGVDPTKANNKELNPEFSRYAQEWKNQLNPAMADIVSQGIYALYVADKVAGEGKEIKEGFDNMVIKGAVGAVNLLGAVGILSTNKLKNDPSKRYQEDHTLFTESVKGHVDIGSMDNYQYASDYASLIVEKFDAYAKSKKTETEQLNTQLKTADSTESVVIRELIKQQQDDLIAAFNQSTKAVQQLDKNNTTDAKIHQDLLAKSLIDTKIAIIKPNQRKQ